MRYPPPLLTLIQWLKRLPGVGNKSAERFAFHLLSWTEKEVLQLSSALSAAKKQLTHCADCGCLMEASGCQFCQDTKRDRSLLCVIASFRDVFSIEETREYNGLYHVLDGLLSPLNRKGPEALSIEKLKQRIASLEVKEIVIALDSTLEGDATALFLKKEIEEFSPTIRISRLAFGLPIGSSLDYIDGGTLARAFIGRNRF